MIAGAGDFAVFLEFQKNVMNFFHGEGLPAAGDSVLDTQKASLREC